MMRKNHPLLPNINRAIFAQKMLILRAQRKYYTYRPYAKCNEQRQKEQALCKFLKIFKSLKY